MYFSFGTLALICLIAAVVCFWRHSLRVREFANAAAVSACERMGLQFLDGTAAFAELRLIREGARFRLRRTYVFDYTAESIERRQGFVILSGLHVDYVGFAPEHTARPNPVQQPWQQSDEAVPQRTPSAFDASRNASGNVLDLQARRAQRAARGPKRDRLQ